MDVRQGRCRGRHSTWGDADVTSNVCGVIDVPRGLTSNVGDVQNVGYKVKSTVQFFYFSVRILGPPLLPNLSSTVEDRLLLCRCQVVVVVCPPPWFVMVRDSEGPHVVIVPPLCCLLEVGALSLLLAPRSVSDLISAVLSRDVHQTAHSLPCHLSCRKLTPPQKNLTQAPQPLY